LGALGPLRIGDDEAVTIYRDYDDGLFGRSLYRGVVFSVKLDAFDRYRSLALRDIDGLTAYLVSPGRAAAFADAPELRVDRNGRFVYDRNGLRFVFSLERASPELFAEIERTYPDRPDVVETVSAAYRSGYVVRVHEAENVYRPESARIDYEDVLVAAALIGDRFQPLWGIHDGNALAAGEPAED